MHVDAAALRRQRMRRAMTQQELATEAGVSPITISRMENGASGPVKPPTLRKLANALGVAPEELLDWSTPADETKKLSA